MSPDPQIVIAELEILQGSDNPENLARRLGYQDKGSLARLLIRHGRTDLARPFERVEASGGS